MKTCEREGCNNPVPEVKNDGAPQRFCSRSCSAKANAAASRGTKLKAARPKVSGRGRLYHKGFLE